MKRVLHITLTVLFGISLAGLLAGCEISMKEDIARSTTEFNLVAEKAGNALSLNMVMLGALVGCNATPLEEESIKKAIENTTKKAFLDSNLQAFDFGVAAARAG